jgi:predicted nucleotidyltransferase
LDRLAALNMLTVRRVVRAKLYKLRSGNIINERLLEPLFANEGKLLEEQLQNFAGNIGDIAESIILFGSAARGEEVHGSDLDLCVVVADTEIRENAEKIITDQIGFLTDATGITPTIFTITQSDFQQRLKKGDSLLKAIVKDGRVVVGTSIESLISNYGKEEINYKSK